MTVYHLSAAGVLAASNSQVDDARRHLQELKPGNFWHGSTSGYPAVMAMQELQPSLTLLDRVSKELDLALATSPSPLYKRALAAWHAQVPRLSCAMTANLDDAEILIRNALRALPVSHFNFRRIHGVGRGFTCAGGQRLGPITHVDPCGLGAAIGLAAGDYLHGFDGPVAADGGFQEGGYVQFFVRKRDAPPTLASQTLGIRLKQAWEHGGELGVTVQEQPGGRVQVVAVDTQSAARPGGLRVGDHILTVGEYSAQQGFAMQQPVGVPLKLTVRRGGTGPVERLRMTPQAHVATQSPSTKRWCTPHGMVTYVSIPNLDSHYDPTVVHAAFALGADDPLWIINLVRNTGGISDQLMMSFLAPGTLTTFVSSYRCQAHAATGDKTADRALERLILEASHDILAPNLWPEHDGDRAADALRAVLLQQPLTHCDNAQTRQNMHDELDAAMRQLRKDVLPKLASDLRGARHAGMHAQTSRLHSQHSRRVHAWFHTLTAQLNKLHTQTCRGRAMRLCEKREKQNTHWHKPMVDAPVRYRGTVAFLIEGAACAAEECAAVVMEYQALREARQLREHVYQNELFPQRVGVFGKSRGAMQLAGQTIIHGRHTDHRLSFPAGEVETAILRNRLEGKGLQGFDIIRDDDPDKELQGMIHQAMAWGFGSATRAP